MSEPVNHHWWPQVQQRYWVDKNGFIQQIRNGKTFSAKPPKTAKIRHHNTFTLPDGRKDLSVEKWFGEEIENNVKAIFEKIRNPKPLIPKIISVSDTERKRLIDNNFSRPGEFYEIDIPFPERETLSLYIASMVVRVPTYREQLSFILNGLRNRAFDFLNEPIREIEAPEERNEQIRWMINHLEDFAKKISYSFWMISRCVGNSVYFFSDTSVIPHRQNDGRTSLDFPLFPDMMLHALLDVNEVILNKAVPIAYVQDNYVQGFNYKLIAQSKEAVFSSEIFSDDQIQFVAEHLGTRKHDVCPPDERQVQDWLHSLS